MNLKKIISAVILLAVSQTLFSQEKWDLERAVEYALANNISVKQADVDARLAALNLKQAKQFQFPTLNVSGNTGLYGGRSINPTTNLFTNQQILSSSFNLNSQMTVFNFFSLRRNIEAKKFDNAAAEANYEKIKS